ncbi:MAG: hypothetical protein QXX68_00320 [Candidatus Pacearchaeota archaeon]
MHNDESYCGERAEVNNLKEKDIFRSSSRPFLLGDNPVLLEQLKQIYQNLKHKEKHEENIRAWEYHMKLSSERSLALNCQYRVERGEGQIPGCSCGRRCNYSFGRTVDKIGDFPALCGA